MEAGYPITAIAFLVPFTGQLIRVHAIEIPFDQGGQLRDLYQPPPLFHPPIKTYLLARALSCSCNAEYYL